MSVPAVASAVCWSRTRSRARRRRGSAGCGETGSCGHVRAHAERGGDECRTREPEQPRARLSRGVEPWGEHGQQRERPVRVVQMVRRFADGRRGVGGRARPALRPASAPARGAVRLAAAYPRLRAHRAPAPAATQTTSTRNAFTWWAVSIDENLQRGSRGRRRQARSDFELTSDSGETVKLSDLRGKQVVLYFYPKDDTPGCTAQACGIRDVYGEFERAGAVVLGVSPDDERVARQVQGEVRAPVHAARRRRPRRRRALRRLGREDVHGQDVHGHRPLDVRDRARTARSSR